jgi:hypothetical protein
VRTGLPGKKNIVRIMKFASKWAEIDVFGEEN